MNKKMYKQILVAMMFSSVSTAVFAAEQDVRPVSLESMNTAVASAPLAAERQSDVPPALRETLSRKIQSNILKRAAKTVKKKGADPVIVVGRVAPNEAVQLNLPKTVGMALDYNRDIKMAHYDLKSAEYAINEARAGKMPQVDYSFSASRSSAQTGTGVSAIGNRFTNGLSVNIPL